MYVQRSRYTSPLPLSLSFIPLYQLKASLHTQLLTPHPLSSSFFFSYTAISKWEQGVNPIPKAVVNLLSEANTLELSIEELEAVHEFAKSEGLTFQAALITLIKSGLKEAAENDLV